MKQKTFPSRTAAKSFAKANGGKFVDNGTSAEAGTRWGVVVEKVAKSKTAAKSKSETKVSQAEYLVKKMLAKQATRKDVIAKLSETLGMSVVGASTYYYNAKKSLGL